MAVSGSNSTTGVAVSSSRPSLGSRKLSSAVVALRAKPSTAEPASSSTMASTEFSAQSASRLSADQIACTTTTHATVNPRADRLGRGTQ
jgi:hypothetical protein